MKISSLFLFCLLFLNAASSQTFKHHQIGETAQQFFSVATVSQNGGLTTTYCTQYLSDPKVMKAYEKAQQRTMDFGAIKKSSDVAGCRQVQAAIDGKDAEVGARYAAEVGQGSVTFHNAKLAVIVFDVKAGTPLEDVMTDISRELGGVEASISVETLQNGFGATLQLWKAVWNANQLVVAASEMRDFQYGDLGISVVVADSAYYKQKEELRQSDRPNTIR